MEDKYLRIMDWALGEDTGISSKALCRHMVGLKPNREHYQTAPSDSADRGRCIRLLNKFPEWWDRLDEMSQYPSSKVTVFRNKGVSVEEHGWKQQIPIIKNEGKR